ncbi:MAG: sigma-54 dependent transcriptional regulator [Pirellulaceae bacterium]|jgi:DNA-binding NtrC family response regulator|nr:sigma-54 dependent transcriptional regulator [Pirellulaceae bacterium]MDP7015747.1 sigma-54 dependent transcriptional regulator [Pirellulaceae bacterium]
MNDQLAAAILIVDDHPRSRESMADILDHAGHQVQCSASAIEALRILADHSFDVIVTDLRMPGMNGLEFIRELRERRIDSQIAMVTAHATVSSAVEAMRHGAFDYIEKPFDVDHLEHLIDRAIQHGQLDAGDASVSPAGDAGVMIGGSQAMQQLRKRIQLVAPTDETALISGESGTGKELVARAIHANSRRASHPLVSMNCPALSPQLMESELFGHERGAFTSADAPRIGRFELAEGGTILFDEITEIDLGLQAKLLRVLQERCFERVGDSRTRHVDVRVAATTNRNLEEEVEQSRFRQDLYFRLAVVPIQVPPLRDRLGDIPELLAHFIDQSARRLESDPCEFTASAYELLSLYRWPGNVRELENLVTRCSVLSDGQPIDADDLRPWLLEDVGDDDAMRPIVQAGLSLEAMERQLIEATLQQFGGHRERTAGALGIGVRTLSNKLRNYGYAPRANAPAA